MTWKRAKLATLLALYCAVLFLLFDFGYGAIFPKHRIPDDVYHHGLRPGMLVDDRWGGEDYRFYINELGFKDTKLESGIGEFETNVLIIGDSFTEGTGLPAEQTFAGLLAAYGREGARPLGVYNAGLSSYSPAIYYKRIKHAFETIRRFDHVIVFVDLADVWDEAWRNFCVDDDPRYRQHCGAGDTFLRLRNFLIRNFPKSREIYEDLAKRLRTIFVRSEGEYMDDAESERYFRHKAPRSAWTIEGMELADEFEPLGVEGGIERSLQNMTKLHAFLEAQGASLSVVVYPWPMQLQYDDRDSRQSRIWAEFCEPRCLAFVDLFPQFFAVKDALEGDAWYRELYIPGDVHFDVGGHRLVAEALEETIDRLRR